MDAPENQKIRPAIPTDYKIAAPLIVQAMGELACFFGQSENPLDAVPLFEHFFQLPANPYSFENTIVCEIDGVVAGSIIGYDGKNLLKYKALILNYLKKKHQKFNLKLEDETQAGEFYLDTVSVSPEFQGQGIGAKLILAMILGAQNLGHHKVGLLVADENPAANKLYTRLGFQPEGKKIVAGNSYLHLVLQV